MCPYFFADHRSEGAGNAAEADQGTGVNFKKVQCYFRKKPKTEKI